MMVRCKKSLAKLNPLERHGFALHKGEFCDAIALRNGWPVLRVPEKCVCNAPFSADHAMICRRGGYPTLRHNEVRNLVASALDEVCTDASVEPRLQQLRGDEALPSSTKKEDEARLDVKARGFWNNDGQDAFFDVRVFHPFAPTYQCSSLTLLYRQHQNQKRREYGFRVRQVERGSFTQLVFTANGGAAPEAATFLKRLASQVSDKNNEPYSVVMSFLRCRVSFSLLRSSLLCLRGSRSNRSLNTTCLSQDSLSLVASEWRLNWMITCSWQVPSLFVCLSECICLIALSILLKQHIYSTFRLHALFLHVDMLFNVNFYFLLFTFSFVLLVIMCALCIVFNKTCFKRKEKKKTNAPWSLFTEILTHRKFVNL